MGTQENRDSVVTYRGQVVFRGTNRETVEFAYEYEHSCTISSAAHHAGIRPEYACPPYATDFGFIDLMLQMRAEWDAERGYELREPRVGIYA